MWVGADWPAVFGPGDRPHGGHADSDPRFLEQADPLGTGELAALVAIGKLGRG